MTASAYVERLRRHIGNDLLLLPSVAVLVRDESGRLLLARHAHTGQWGTVGGAVEPGESQRQAAVRETLEETGLKVRLGALIAAVAGPSYEVVYPNGGRVAYAMVVYEATVTEGLPVADGEEITELGWFAPEELDSADLSSFARVLLGEIGVLREPNPPTDQGWQRPPP
jgi:8-oxo-dGTP pyrophosphatase MutT (NUDIX family)